MTVHIEPGADPSDYIITRKRKLYKFAAFQSLGNCYDDQTWPEIKSTITNHRPLIVEVGAGSGLFLTELARRHPDRQYLAIDRKSDRLYRGAKLASDEGLANIAYLWSNARNLASLLPAGSVDELWITFPDPWPQESNIKHRLTNPQFLAQYHKLLSHNGQLKFKTDNQPLFDWSVGQFDDNWQIIHQTHDLHHDPSISTNDDARVMTTYEQRYTRDGKLICYLVATHRR